MTLSATRLQLVFPAVFNLSADLDETEVMLVLERKSFLLILPSRAVPRGRRMIRFAVGTVKRVIAGVHIVIVSFKRAFWTDRKVWAFGLVMAIPLTLEAAQGIWYIYVNFNIKEANFN